MSSLFSKTIKRKIAIDKIDGITYSNISNHFVIHCPTEYDYNLSCIYKDQFIQTILKSL